MVMYPCPCAQHMVEVIVSRQGTRETQHTEKGESILLRRHCLCLLSA